MLNQRLLDLKKWFEKFANRYFLATSPLSVGSNLIVGKALGNQLIRTFHEISCNVNNVHDFFN